MPVVSQMCAIIQELTICMYLTWRVKIVIAAVVHLDIRCAMYYVSDFYISNMIVSSLAAKVLSGYKK